MDKRATGNFSIGITSIAVIFTVVCLTIFAVLSLSTASQERKLSEKYADSVTAYWQADSRCTELVNRFGALWEGSASIADYQSLAAESGVELWEDGENVVVYFLEPIDEGNSLAVALRIGREFEIAQWQQLHTGAWEPDEGIDLWEPPVF